MSVQIIEVTSSKEFQAFFEFPWTLYKDDPNWVPPLLSMRKELFDKKKNPAWDYLDGSHFLAMRGDQPVGTISAIINHRHNDFTNERIGWFGMFECIQDQEVADALLQRAADWVKAQGDYNAIRGPQSFTTHEETGLLVDGFTPPTLLTPYNPPYYQELIENSPGFEKCMDVISIYFDHDIIREHNMSEKMQKIGERAMRSGRVKIRPIDLKRKDEEFKLFRDLYNEVWAENWSFVPMTDRELDALVHSLGQFVDPNLAFFTEVDGQPAGFILAVPNFNEVLKKVYPRPGVPEWFSLIKAGYYWKIAKIIRSFRTPLMGVKKEYREMGLEMLMYSKVLESVVTGGQYLWGDFGWILETNKLVKMSLKMGGEIYKRHRFFEKDLTD